MTIDSGFFPAPWEEAFTPEEENALKARLFALLAKQARLGTQGDHSSLREEDAAELLRSLVFTLRFHLRRSGLPMRALLTADLPDALKRGQAALQSCLDETKALYGTALQTVAVFGSRPLADTLASVGLFFRSYDVRLYAHRIPAFVDYPLSVPVPEELGGAPYIRAYLMQLLTENALLTRFAPARVTALLRRASPAYRELPINLYEPVAANVVGLSLLGGGETLLEITRAQAAQIHGLLAPLPPAEARCVLIDAARATCERLSLSGSQTASCLSAAAVSLYPRAVISPQSACGVFSAC